MTLGERITAAREHIGLTQRQLAKAVGVSHSLVSLWESDTRAPSFDNLVKIADITLRELTYLRYGEEGPPDLDTPHARNDNELEALRLFRRVSERQRQNLIRVMQHCLIVVKERQAETTRETV